MTYVTATKAQVLAQDVEKLAVGSNIDLPPPLINKVTAMISVVAIMSALNSP